MKRRRRMTAKQLKYFGKRKSRTVYKTKVIKMARRRSYRGRARSYARKGMGGMKSLIMPIGAGVAEQYINNFIPISGIAPTMIGVFTHDSTLKTIGLYQVGLSLGNIIPLPGIGGSSSGGGF